MWTLNYINCLLKCLDKAYSLISFGSSGHTRWPLLGEYVTWPRASISQSMGNHQSLKSYHLLWKHSLRWSGVAHVCLILPTCLVSTSICDLERILKFHPNGLGCSQSDSAKHSLVEICLSAQPFWLYISECFGKNSESLTVFRTIIGFICFLHFCSWKI